MKRPPKMDDAQPLILPQTNNRPVLSERLKQAFPVLAGAVLVVLAFTLFGGLRPEWGLCGLLVLIVLILWRSGTSVAVRVGGGNEISKPGDQFDVEAFAEALGDPALVLDHRGAIVYRNAAAGRQYMNLQPGQVLILSLRNPELINAVENSLRSGEVNRFELHETFPSETWNRVTVAPLKSPEKDWSHPRARQLLVTFQSLTELKKIDALRSDFIANASHELRTPLASLTGFIDTLLGPAANDATARAKFLGIMRGQADRMSRLIDDMLSLSRIEMHQHLRPTGSVDLAALVREVRDGLQGMGGDGSLDILLDVPDMPAVVTGDRGELYEVVENLIENAVKYGGIDNRVEVRLQPTDRLGMRYQLSVVDHGPGVEPEHVPRMTERFYRIDAEASRKKKGTGLGLAIVKHIVQRHRGQLSIKSRMKPGEGLRVEILLP